MSTETIFCAKITLIRMLKLNPKKIKETKKLDAVFEGGGVKGSALIGAIAVTEALGYKYENLAGTSAGAIVASLLAAGYNAAELKDILDSVEYNSFKDVSGLGKVSVVGPVFNLLAHKGIYNGDVFFNWITKLLAAKNIHTFKDLVIPEYAKDLRYRYKLQVIASDISRGKLLVLPGDAKDYGIKPDNLEVAVAIRMSMSIPYFFRPVVVHRGVKEKDYIVDGGVLSSFPVWLLDDGTANPKWPTIGYKLVDPQEDRPHKIYGPITLFGALISTMMEAHDARYIKDSDFMRTIPIPTLGVHGTDFSINNKTKNDLYNSGAEAATKFFSNWDFESYKKKYRSKLPPSRTERLWQNKKTRI